MSPTPTRKSRVLAVDDIAANLVALDALLHREYEVIRANSGAEAVKILEVDSDIDVILMDIQMPGMDGYEAATRIKAMKACRDIPIIFITAVFSEDPHVKRGYAVGGIDYFAKPFDPEILKLKVSVYAAYRRRALTLREREEQVQRSEELLVTARKLSALFESPKVGVLLVDGTGGIFQTNEEALRLLGHELTAWWNGAALGLQGGAALRQAVRAGRPIHNEVLTVPGHDGQKRILRAAASPLHALDGTPAGAVIVLQDLTDHRRTGEELELKIASLIALGAELQHGLNH